MISGYLLYIIISFAKFVQKINYHLKLCLTTPTHKFKELKLLIFVKFGTKSFSIFADQPQCFTEPLRCDMLYNDLKDSSGDWSLKGCVNMTGFNTT